MEQRIFNDVKDSVSNVQSLATKKYKQAANVVDGYVSNNPWKSIGIVAAVGALLGFLAAKR